MCAFVAVSDVGRIDPLQETDPCCCWNNQSMVYHVVVCLDDASEDTTRKEGVPLLTESVATLFLLTNFRLVDILISQSQATANDPLKFLCVGASMVKLLREPLMQFIHGNNAMPAKTSRVRKFIRQTVLQPSPQSPKNEAHGSYDTAKTVNHSPSFMDIPES